MKKSEQYIDEMEELRHQKLSKEEILEQDEKIQAEVAMLRDIQESLSREIAKYMSKENIGIVELTRRLATSTRQTNRIMKGEANLTIATVAEIATLMGTKVRIVFEPAKVKKYA